MIDNIILGFACTLAITAIITIVAIGWVEYCEWKDKKSYRG